MTSARTGRLRNRSGNRGGSLPQSLTLLVVDDSHEARERLARVASKAFPNGIVVAATSLCEAFELLARHTVDIALVDLELSDGSGLELIQECARSSPLTRCVVSTIHHDDEHLTLALSAGALGYLLNNQTDSVLIQQLRLLADGVPPLAPPIALRLVQHFAEMARSAPAAPPQARSEPDKLMRLSQREQEVLTLIAQGKQIAEVAQALHITANTVCSHVKSIYRKRELSCRAEAALEAKRLGLV